MSKGRTSSTCPICAHQACAEITALLASGMDVLAVAQKFAVTTRGLRKHMAHGSAPAHDPALVAPRKGTISNVGTPPFPQDGPTPTAKVIPFRGATCVVCAHPRRREIDGELAKGRASSAIARRFLLDVAALRTHQRERIAEPIGARGANDSDDGPAELGDQASALERARAQANRLQSYRVKFVDEHPDDAFAIMKIEDAEGAAIQRLARLTGELGPADEKRLIGTPQFQRVMQEILAELQPHPEIARRIGERLARIEGVA